MALFIGFTVSSPRSGELNIHLTPSLNLFTLDYWPARPQPLSSTRNAHGAAIARYAPARPTVTARAGAGVAPSYFRDYYNRVHVRPARIALGNVLSSQSRQIEVWNAHLSSRALGSIAATNADGLTLTGPQPAPTTFQALESRDYTLAISNVGSPTVNAAFRFAFTGETPVLRVTGNRVSIWRVRPNWEQGIREHWEWLTDVLTAHNNREQRVRLRGKPRRSIEFDILPLEQDRQWLENALWRWQARTFAVPLWTDRRHLTQPAAAGTATLNLDTRDAEFEVGGLVILLANGIAEAGEITAITGGSLTLKTPLQSDWPASTAVWPARLGMIGDRQTLDRLTDTMSRAVVRFDFEDAGQAFTAQDSAASYRGWPVFEDGPNWVEDLQQEYQHKVRQYDWRTGDRFVEYQAEVPNQLQSFRWTLNGRAAIDAFRRWLYARAGRLVPFWFPQPSNDLTATQIIGAGSTQLTVRHANYALFAQGQPGRQDIRIQLRDGTVLYRRIVAASEAPSGTEEHLQLDAALSATAATNPADIVQISYLQPCRLNQDAVEIIWHTDQLAESSAIIRSLNDGV